MEDSLVILNYSIQRLRAAGFDFLADKMALAIEEAREDTEDQKAILAMIETILITHEKVN